MGPGVSAFLMAVSPLTWTAGQWIILLFIVLALPGIAAIAACISATSAKRKRDRDP